MGGFAALLGGIHGPLENYSHQQRQHAMDTWQTLHKDALETVDEALKRANTPEAVSGLVGLRSKIAGARPGDPPDKLGKLIQEAQLHLSPHPGTIEALIPPQPQKGPGPAQPGTAPGTPQTPMASLLSKPADANLSAAPPTAQPATSPVQPSAQQGAKPIGMLDTLRGQAQKFYAAGQVPPVQLVNQLQPIVAKEAMLEEVGAQQQMEIQRKQATWAEMKQQPWYAELPDVIKGQYAVWASTPGAQLPSTYGIGNMMTPRPLSNGTLGSSAPEGTLEYGTNRPVSPNGLYAVKFIPATGETVWQPIAPQVVTAPTAGGAASFNKQTGQQIAPLEGAIPGSMNTPHFETTASGGREMIRPVDLTSGLPPVRVPGAVNPAMMPTISTSERPVQVTGPDGQPMTQMVPMTTVSQKGGSRSQGGAPTVGGTPATPRQFEKPLTPLQHLTETQKYEQYGTAIDRAQRVIKNAHIFSSLVESGKLQIAMDSSLEGNIIRAVLSRGMKFTPAEEQMVKDFNSLRESVNLIRGPLGATGFRGPEAFAALQAQRGSLLSNPAITKGVLETFIQELKNQRGPIGQKLHRTDSTGTGDIPEIGNDRAAYDRLPSGAKYKSGGVEYIKR